MEETPGSPVTLVLPYGPAHRNDGAAMYMVNAFNRMIGVKALRVNYLPGVSNETWPAANAYIDIDWAQDCFPEISDQPCRHPHVWWCSDAHVSSNSFAWRINRAVQADVTVVCQKDHGRMFNEAKVHPVYWLPHAAEHTCYTPILKHYDDESRMALPPIPEAWAGRFVAHIPKYDWCFVGHVNNDRRIDALDALAKAYPNWLYGKLFFEEAAKAYGNAKIVFNICHERDLNMRFFEATSSRACLLTEWLPELEELGYRHREHCLLYRTIPEAVDLMGQYLDPSKDWEREDIAERGWRKTWGAHTYWQRARDLLLLCQMHGYVPLSEELRVMLETAPPATF